MLQKLATPGRHASFLNGSDKSLVILEYAVHRFLHHLFGVLADAGGDLLKSGLLVRGSDALPCRQCTMTTKLKRYDEGA